MVTAFVSTHESAAYKAYLDFLLSDRAFKTEITYGTSGRPACALVTHFTNELWVHDRYIPSCLTAFGVCKALNADASARVHPI